MGWVHSATSSPSSPCGEGLVDGRELRREDSAVLGACGPGRPRRPEELDVPQWLTLSGPIEPMDRCLRYQAMFASARGEHGDAGAGVGDLRGGREHDRPVRVPRGGGQDEDVGALGLVLGEVVERVGVVPEDGEVGRGRRHRGQSCGDLLGDDAPVGFE